jgi:hypothetical protein
VSDWNPPDSLEKTAYHEAGHAVLVWTFGVPPVGGLHLDHVKQGGRVDGDRRAAERLPPVHEIAFWLAGYEAEQIFRPPGRRKAAAVDFGEAQRVLRETKTRLRGPALRNKGRALARARLREHEAGVHRVARELVEQSSVSLERFLELVKGPFLWDGEGE